MDFELLSRPDQGHPLSVWSQLADIEEVEGELGARDRAFLRAVGELLAEQQVEGRFAVTLLHSHFPVARDEALVEAITEDDKLVTEVQPLGTAEADPAIVPQSWMFADACAANGGEELSVLTWTRRDHLPQAPLSPADRALIADMAQLFRSHGMTGRFGLALAGPAPGTGMIWTEGNDAQGRHLMQIRLPVEEVERRGPVMTRYGFGPGGAVVRLGCCTQHHADAVEIAGHRRRLRC